MPDHQKRPSLCRLAAKYGSDKCLPEHNYTPFYAGLLSGRRIHRVLEIGIGTGASLRMWAEYFPDAEIFGMDIDESRLVNEGRIRSFFCDQGDEAMLWELKLASRFGLFDLIIDDGSHRLSDQVISAGFFVRCLNFKGLYAIEDIAPANRNALCQALAARVPFPFELIDLDLSRRYDDCLIVIERL